MHERRIDAAGAAVLISFSALIGLNQVLIKLVNAGMHPVFQAGLRSACAFLPILLFARLARRRLALFDGSLLPGLAVGLLFGLEFVLLFLALDYTSVSRASVLFYTMPFWLTLGAHFLLPGERLHWRRVAGLSLAFSGVVLALSRNENPATPLALLGDLLCLIAAMLWATIALLTRVTKLTKSCPEMQLLYQLGVSAPLLIVVALLNGDLLREPTPLIWGMFTFQVVVVVCVGFLAWFWVLSVYSPPDVAVYSFLAPVFGVVSGRFILAERVGWNIGVALALVALGIVLVNWRQSTRSRPVA